MHVSLTRLAAPTIAGVLVLGATGSALAQDAPLRAALVTAHRFGDQGPMDAFAAGLDRCASELGFEITKLESVDPAGYEDDVRAVAAEGYDLILTTFPPMTLATTAVAQEFPDQAFRAIYQFVNMPGEEPLANVSSTEYHGNDVAYVLGVIAGHLSQSGHLGSVAGSDDPALNASINAWAQGVLSVNPAASVEFGVAGSFEDPAKGKEIALAMASRGVDVISTEAAKTQLGVIEGARESGILVQGDVADNAAMYPEGYVGYVGLDYSTDVFLACQELADGAFSGGTHTVLDLSTGTYAVPWDVIDAWAATQTFTDADTATAAIAAGRSAESAILDGSLVVRFDASTPDAASLTGGIAVHAPWARAVPDVATPGAAYLQLMNHGASDDALLSASSPAAGAVELHETSPDASGMMAMHPVERIELPAGATVALEPGGYHVMLIDLVAPLVEGSTIPLTLTFEHGPAVTVEVQVVSVTGEPMPSMDHTGHHDHAMPSPSAGA